MMRTQKLQVDLKNPFDMCHAKSNPLHYEFNCRDISIVELPYLEELNKFKN